MSKGGMMVGDGLERMPCLRGGCMLKQPSGEESEQEVGSGQDAQFPQRSVP